MVLRSLLGEDADILREWDFRAMLAANLLAPLGIPLVSPLLNSLAGPFGVSTTRVGLLISAYTAPPIFLIPVVGVLADRYGRKPLLLTGILLFGIGGTSIAFTSEFGVAVVLRFLQGVGFAGLTPIVITSLGDLYDGSREATAQGLRFTSSGVYQAIFPPIAGVLVGFAWQYPFLIYALAFPVAAVVYLWFDEPLDGRRAADEGGSDSAGDSPNGGGSQVRELARLVRRPRVLSLVVGRSLPMLAWVGFLTYNSLLVVRAMNGSAAEAGILVTINSVTLALGASQAGRITAMWDSRMWPLVAANVGLGGGLVVVAFAPSLSVAALGTALLGLGFGVSLSLYRSVVTGLAPPTLRGGLVSVAESLGRVASTATPIGMGVAVTALTPTLGFVDAVRWTTVGVGVLVGGVGQLCLVVARLSRE
ncbi:MAG: MFS transporter [Haloferacaceae archaeon]